MEIYKTIKITSTQYKNYTCPYWNLMSFFCHSQKYCIKIYLFRTKFSIFLTNFSINLTLIFQLFLPEFSKSKFLHVCVYVCVCVCACVRACVCLYSSTCWFLLAARRLWHTWDVRINDLLLWVLLRASAKFLHLHFQICHI